MDFSIASIKVAHNSYTGFDIPKLISVFKLMGITTNIYGLETGLLTYINLDGIKLEYKSFRVDF